MYYDNFLAETLLYREELNSEGTPRQEESKDQNTEKGESHDDRMRDINT